MSWWDHVQRMKETTRLKRIWEATITEKRKIKMSMR